MKLIAYNYKTGMGCFECQECEALKHARRRIVRKCVECGHADESHQHTSYQWRKRRVGYARLIPTEQWNQAAVALRRATKEHGMAFKTMKTFAGIKVIVEIEAVYKSDPREII